jgi:hypothetical protein
LVDIQLTPNYENTLRYYCYPDEKAASDQWSEDPVSKIAAGIFEERSHPVVRDRAAPFRTARPSFGMADDPHNRGFAPALTG